MKWSISSVRWLMIGLVAVETACGTYFTKNNPEVRGFISLVYLASGLLIGILPLFRYSFQPSKIQPLKNTFFKQLFIATFFIGVLAYALPHIYWILDWIEIDYRSADMIPQIQVACKRWLVGEQVYSPIPEIWGGLLPTYLPLMWMPYAPLQLLNADVRWTTVFFYLAGICLLLWMLARSTSVNWLQLLIILTLIGNMVFIQTDYNRVFFAWSQEGLVVGYYLLLGYALTKNNPWLTGIAITCCLLSRYALFFWIPAYLLFYFLAADRKNAFIQASVIVVLTTIIFIIPYFLDDPNYFLLLPEKYSEQVRVFWVIRQKEISQSLGMAKFFPLAQFRLLHNIQLALSIAVPVFFYILLYRFRRHPLVNLSFAGLCGLKLTLTFFYNFLEAPYFYYLFIVPTLFSYVILFHFLHAGAHVPASASISK